MLTKINYVNSDKKICVKLAIIALFYNFKPDKQLLIR